MSSMQDIIRKTENFVQDRLLGESTGHDWWHVERIRATARRLREAEGGDELIIELSLLLHDVGDRKVIGEKDDDYTIAENFLREQDLDKKKIEIVMDIIMNISFSHSLDKETVRPSSIEFQIVQDADRLDAIGAIGIARTFAFGGSRKRQLYNPEHSAVKYTSRDEYVKSESSTLHHFDEKLFSLKDKLNTQTARKIALERDLYMHDFYQRFLDEWDGQK